MGWSLSNNFNNNFPPKNNLITGPINSAIEKAKLKYLKSLEPMATRKCSEQYLEIVSKISNLIEDQLILLDQIILKLKITILLNQEIFQEITFIMV